MNTSEQKMKEDNTQSQYNFAFLSLSLCVVSVFFGYKFKTYRSSIFVMNFYFFAALKKKLLSKPINHDGETEWKKTRLIKRWSRLFG